MSLKYSLCFLLSLIGFSYGQKGSSEIDGFGRRIQLDGFLLEWNQKDAHSWKDSTLSFSWDAINTSDGLAGYFKSDKPVSCSLWVFSIIPQGDVEAIVMSSGIDTSASGELYKFDKVLLDSAKMVVCEWLIPYKRLGVDISGRYSFIINGWNECGDSLHPMLITGSNEKSQGIFSGSFVIRSILIAMLLVIYILLSIRLRNRNRHKELPHQ